MSSQRFMKRIQMELRELEQSKNDLLQNGIEYAYDEQDMRNIYFMIYGQEDTPYYGGFYFFHFRLPDNYPMEPPIVKYHTQGLYMDSFCQKSKYFRFNPNLYTADQDGKVCLSMINTWTGPSWVPTNTLVQVIIAIQAFVLNQNPLENEPGYEDIEQSSNQMEYETYKKLITYMSFDIGMTQMYFRPPFQIPIFTDSIRRWIISNKPKIIEHIERCIEKYGNESILCRIDVFSIYTSVSFEELKTKIQLFLEHDDFR